MEHTASEPPRVARRGHRALGVALVVVLAVAAYVAFGRDGGTAATITPAQVDALLDAKLDKAVGEIANAPARSALVYQAIVPSLVVIQADKPGGGSDAHSLGSGVIVNRDGLIMTAWHVVDGATRVTVAFADGTQARATVDTADKEHDIATLVADRLPEVVVPAVLGGGGRVGDEAYAVGHPFGLVGSLTSGVISGLDRSVPRPGGGTIEGLIQFDAAVNPGNSGGPLLNRNGQVIGIVTALANTSKDGFFIGIGYAVPIGTAGGAAQAPPK